MLSLTKWYLDCIEDPCDSAAAPRAWIFYWARLNLGPLSLSYASVIQTSPATDTTETRSFGLQPSPILSDTPDEHAVTLNLRSLNAKGTWSRDCTARPISARLYETHDGAVTWNAHLPRARVDLEIAGRHITGHGYAESLELTIAPWKLPIDTLRWGRLIAGDHHAVWINWEGPLPRTDLWLDGVHHASATFTDDSIHAGTTTITHTPICTIRKGPLGTNVLDSIPLLRGVVPPRMRSAHEDKQFSSSILDLNGKRHAGHSIHETIRFGGTT
jgi:hypothetical protein